MKSYPWYVDAWSVSDGAIFVTRRAPGDPGQGQNTVFMCVPDLQPVPVGRRSTALAATRRNFQFGLTDADGSEIAFDSLEQVSELVRRGFLAGGLGPGGPLPDDTPPEPEPNPDDRLPTDRPQPFSPEGFATWTNGEDPRSDLRKLAGLFRPATVEQARDGDTSGAAAALRSAIQRCVQTVTKEWETRLSATEDLRDARLFANWWQFLYSTWGTHLNIDFADSFGWTMVKRLAAENYFGRSPTFIAASPEVSTMTIVQAAPLIIRTGSTTYSGGLGDSLVLPIVDFDYFRSNGEWKDLAGPTLAALILTCRRNQPIGTTLESSPNAGVDLRIATALEWFSDQVPQRRSVPIEAELALQQYTYARMRPADNTSSP